jgi:hypothetical protein
MDANVAVAAYPARSAMKFTGTAVPDAAPRNQAIPSDKPISMSTTSTNWHLKNHNNPQSPPTIRFTTSTSRLREFAFVAGRDQRDRCSELTDQEILACEAAIVGARDAAHGNEPRR